MNIEKIKELGNEWVKGNHHRIYINEPYKFYGLELDKYKGGGIKHATLDGEKISNNQAYKLVQKLDGKFWFDVNHQKFDYKDIPEEMAAKVIEKIKQIIAD